MRYDAEEESRIVAELRRQLGDLRPGVREDRDAQLEEFLDQGELEPALNLFWFRLSESGYPLTPAQHAALVAVGLRIDPDQVARQKVNHPLRITDARPTDGLPEDASVEDVAP